MPIKASYNSYVDRTPRFDL